MRSECIMIICDHCGKVEFIRYDETKPVFGDWTIDGWETTFIPESVNQIELCPNCKGNFSEIKSNYEKNIKKLAEDYRQKIAEYIEGGKTDIGH